MRPMQAIRPFSLQRSKKEAVKKNPYVCGRTQFAPTRLGFLRNFMRLRAAYKKLNNVATSICPQAQPTPTTTGSTVNQIGGNAACSLPLCRRSLRLRGCRRRSGRRRHGRFRLLLHFLRIGRVKNIVFAEILLRIFIAHHRRLIAV